MENWISGRNLLRLWLAAIASVCLVLVPASAALASNNGDVWVDNVGQPAGPGHENDPHLACQDINLWGNGLADSGGSYTIDGYPPLGSMEQDYSSTWSYDQSKGGDQVLDVISVKTLIENAIHAGDVPQANQGFHFQLEFSQDPQKHKTFWVDCAAPSISTTATSNTVGQGIHDSATLIGGDSPTGNITWNVYPAGSSCSGSPVHTASVPVNGDNTYNTPDWPAPAGSYEWVATYSGDANNTPVSTSCHDSKEVSTVSPATPMISTTATSNTVGGPIHDVATLSGGDNPTGTITWNVYTAGSCSAPLHMESIPVNGDGTYNSPDWTPPAGTYEWVATYSGDANNTSLSTSCSDQSEQSTVQQAPAPSVSLVKLEKDATTGGSFTHGPITGNVSDTIDYQMTVVNTGNTSLVITFSDPHCDAGTLEAPTVLAGTYDPATSTLSTGGELQYVCSHVLVGGDAPQFPNTATVTGQPPSGPPVSGTDTVVTNVETPGIHVVKLQRDGTSGGFTSSTINATVGDTIEYEIQVTNTGTAPLTLTLSDPLCKAGSIVGPTAISGTLSGSVLSPGGEAQYTCSHVLSSTDASPFTNTATVTGQPPSGPPVSGVSSVTANKQAVSAVTPPVKCTKGKVKKTKKVHGKKVTVCVAKKVKAKVISRKPIRPAGFTG